MPGKLELLGKPKCCVPSRIERWFAPSMAHVAVYFPFHRIEPRDHGTLLYQHMLHEGSDSRWEWQSRVQNFGKVAACLNEQACPIDAICEDHISKYSLRIERVLGDSIKRISRSNCHSQRFVYFNRLIKRKIVNFLKGVRMRTI